VDGIGDDGTVKIVSAQQMREIDRVASTQYQIPSLILMENAGLRVVEAVETALEGIDGEKRVLILAEPGANQCSTFMVRHVRMLNRWG